MFSNKITTGIPVAKSTDFEFYLINCGFLYFDLEDFNETISVVFFNRGDAVMFILRSVETAYNELPYFYFEPDEEFEKAIVLKYGIHCDFD